MGWAKSFQGHGEIMRSPALERRYDFPTPSGQALKLPFLFLSLPQAA